MKVADYFKLEQRFKMLEKSEPRAAKELLAQAQADVNARRTFYEFLATRKFNPAPNQ
jgi:pyruvate-ferredoxin/flavodoxin oxidoreductase